MLSLDALELIGFKSFAEKTRLTFKDQLTAIIGPNGCGKSNLADAIGWVLGEHAARNVRGQTMEDVIFSGTKARKASGVAEVRLTLRKTADKPIEFLGEELTDETVEISRKVYRSGESFYLVNQRRCRLMDIQKFLEDAGLGFASYALIAQGKIESFLTAKPLERRTIIEEAAQITGYKSRRRRAELKLEMAQQNLVRVADIISEVERQLRSLKRQAAKARRYGRLKEELKELQRQRLVLESGRSTQRLAEIQEQLTSTTQQEEKSKAELQRRETLYKAASEEREELTHALNLLRQRSSEIHLELDRCRNSVRYQREQVASTEKQLEVNKQEQAELQAAIQNIDEEIHRFESEKTHLAAEAKRIEAIADQQGELAARFRADVETAEEKLEDLRSRLVHLSAHRASLQNSHQDGDERLNATVKTRQRLEVSRAEKKESVRKASQQLTEQQEKLETAQARLEELQNGIASERIELQKVEAEIEERAEAFSELKDRLVALRERLQSLHEVELKHSHYSEGVQKALGRLAQNGNFRTAGTLADSIETSAQFERLVEEFLDEELEYILVDDFDDAVGSVAEIKSLESGKCTFLTLHAGNGFGKPNGHNGHPTPEPGSGVFGQLSKLLEMSDEVEQAFLRTLPQQAHAVVVSDLDRAVGLAHHFPEITFVTLEGDVLTSKGLLTTTATGSKKLGLLSLKRQKRELEARLRQEQKKASGSQAELENVKRRRAELAGRLAQQRDSLYELEKQIIGLGHEKDRLSLDSERSDRALADLEQELAEFEKSRCALQARQKEVEEELAAVNKEQTETEALLEEHQEQLRELRSKYGEVQEETNRIRSDAKVLRERELALAQTIQRTREQRLGLTNRIETAGSVEQEAKQRLQDLQTSIEKTQAAAVDRRNEAETVKQDLEEHQTRLDEWRSQFSETEVELSKLRERSSGLREQRSQLEIEKARVETLIQSLQDQCQEQLGVPLEELTIEQDPAQLVVEEVRKKHDELRDKLERFGPINMTALEEYQENEERHEFLTKQREDILRSIADTSRAIQEINRRSRKQFSEAFTAINDNFKEIFQKLFGGGECGMELLDEEDILECGIDVYAQPPGKRLQNVMLLSGGEKALAVFGLLVGIFMYRPSRFCVLDEVDAPLDDANVQRFARLIEEMSRQIKFLVITHNKRTMEYADSLYGITMEDPGISKIVSVQF